MHARKNEPAAFRSSTPHEYPTDRPGRY